MKRGAILVALSAAALVGCGGQDDVESGAAAAGALPGNRLPDGRSVTCIWQTSSYKGGLSCDWENAR
jgi:hypothetical protein